MPNKPNDAAIEDRPRRRITGPRLRKCRSCGDLEVSTRLVHGDCPECAGLQSLPLRGEGGRFMSLTTNPTADDVFSGGGR